MIAVGVHQALAIAQQIAAPLQPLVQIIEVDGVAGRHAGIDDLDAFAEFDAGLARGGLHQILAPHQQRGTQALVHEAGGGADHLLFLALGEHTLLGCRRSRAKTCTKVPATGSRRAFN